MQRVREQATRAGSSGQLHVERGIFGAAEYIVSGDCGNEQRRFENE